MQNNFQKIANDLDLAFQNAKTIAKISSRIADYSLGEFTIPLAYQVQRELIGLRLKRGEKIIGTKMGLTSFAKMKQMGVHEPIYGVLMDVMELKSPARLSAENRIHPKIEPEIAFRLKTDLTGGNQGGQQGGWQNLSPAEKLERASLAIGEVMPALEVIDSRFDKFEFELSDVIADNTSASKFILGQSRAWSHEKDFGNFDSIGMTLFEENEPKQFASSGAVLGHPIESLVAQVELLEKSDIKLKAGMIVLTGGATAAIPMQKGKKYSAIIESLSPVEVIYG